MAGVNQFTQVKVVYSGTVQYIKTNVRDNPQGSTAVNQFQGRARGTYIANLKVKDQEHFGTREESKGPLENLFR